jgi:hypothetical protein
MELTTEQRKALLAITRVRRFLTREIAVAGEEGAINNACEVYVASSGQLMVQSLGGYAWRYAWNATDNAWEKK